jgi:hypothetical protein
MQLILLFSILFIFLPVNAGLLEDFCQNHNVSSLAELLLNQKAGLTPERQSEFEKALNATELSIRTVNELIEIFKNFFCKVVKKITNNHANNLLKKLEENIEIQIFSVIQYVNKTICYKICISIKKN